MPDLMNHVVQTTGSNTQVGPTALSTVAQWQVSGKVVDSATQQTTLATYSFMFPSILTTLTAAQLAQFMQTVAGLLVSFETGY